MQLCAITDTKQCPEPLLTLVEGWATGGVSFIQLREKDLEPSALESLAREVTRKIAGSRTKLLVNIPQPEWAALAMTAGAHGVHLAGEPRPGAAGRVRQGFAKAIISVPCHSLKDVEEAVQEEVDLMLFSPVFEKISGDARAQGLAGLRLACAAAQSVPVFALGGVTADNAPDCIAAGAAGIAGIRLFAGDDWRRL
jgi:thiamine-phosphate pyrophosphorylase